MTRIQENSAENDDDQNDDAGAIRLQRYLAMAGAGSRRHCEEFILAGRVTVDRETIRELGYRVTPGDQDVRLDGERVRLERKTWYLLNKPTGYLCTNNDPDGRMRVIDLFPKDRERLFTVGRLDENSQGLLLVTNDGELAHRLAHPRYRVPRVYQVQVAGIPDRELLEQLKRGLYFAEGRFKVADAKLVTVRKSSAVLELVLMEGQNREIRRLLAKVGHKVQRLERVALGPLELGDLPIGRYRLLTPQEIAALSELVSGGKPRQRKGKPSSGKPGKSGEPQRADKKRPAHSASRSRHPRGRAGKGPR
jgi:23S rRNA pseudouridine2605 synthase